MDANRTLAVGSARLVVALVAGAILVASVVPVPESMPEEGGGIPPSVLFHVVGYAVLAATLAIALSTRRARSAIGGAFVGASGYGALMEVVQLGLPYRTFSWLDIAINAAGAAAGLAVVPILVSRSRGS